MDSRNNIYTFALCENLSQIASSFHTLNIWQCVGDPVFEILYHPGKMVLAAFQTMISVHHEHQKTKECPSWNVRMRCHLCLIIWTPTYLHPPQTPNATFRRRISWLEAGFWGFRRICTKLQEGQISSQILSLCFLKKNNKGHDSILIEFIKAVCESISYC